MQLLWKKIEEEYKAGKYELTEAWCRLCLHKVFDNAGDINRAKIMRSVISDTSQSKTMTLNL